MFQHFNRANLCPATNAVVEALRNDTIADVTEGTAQDDHVADLNLLFDLVRGKSHVNEELADVRHLFLLILGGDMNGAAARVHDSWQIPRGGADGDISCEKIPCVKPTYRVDA